MTRVARPMCWDAPMTPLPAGFISGVRSKEAFAGRLGYHARLPAMCGIAGVFGGRWRDADLSPVLARMSGVMVHRGPDDDGMLVAPDMHAGLAVRRLSLIDLDHGHQPLTNEDGSVAVVCNGEIYNHRELRAVLEGKGHRFATHSDCEGIAHLYEEVRLECFAQLHATFAL